MRALVVVFLVCVTLALCQASVRRATHCTIANDCAGTCEDPTHHWSCIQSACECRTHGVTAAPSPDRPYEGSICKTKEDCHDMHHCDREKEHCYDGRCKCTDTDEHHHG
ncbi:defensin-like protein 290 [Pecten maximus]|uniref:defensin-like protein 290 n=1 Tax=Pecten maximus TaxID=6579 RepID=UPI001457E9B7|nr:defensin-like protein 290 [Pecten maximus]